MENSVVDAAPVRVAVIDDERKLVDMLCAELERRGFSATPYYDAARALESMRDDPPEVALIDIKMPEIDGMQVLRECRVMKPSVECIMITGHGSIDSAVRAMQEGAYHYLTKPTKLQEMEILIEKAAEKSRALRENRILKRMLLGVPGSGREFIAQSPAMRGILARLPAMAQAVDAPLLITGESGTGKEWVAREVHRLGPLADGAFVAINSAGLRPELLETELFGHEKGAFTGAVSQSDGLVELAAGGTLFLDEIGDTDVAIQSKLMRFIQFGEYRRVGSAHTRRVALRVIAATNLSLDEAMARGKFRQDLYHRLRVCHIHLPPLRERREEIPALVEHFLGEACYPGEAPRVLDSLALLCLAAYDWPGNVRELKNIVRKVLLLDEERIIPVASVREAIASASGTAAKPPSLRLADIEQEHIMKVLAICGGNKSRAAKALGIALKTLYNRLKELG